MATKGKVTRAILWSDSPPIQLRVLGNPADARKVSDWDGLIPLIVV